MLDADSPSLSGRWKNVKKKLRHYNYEFPTHPSPNGTFVESDLEIPKLGFWLMPNNEDSGMLEDFCAKLAEPSSLKFAQQCVEQAQANGLATFKSIHRSKSIVHTYLAWHDEPGSPLGRAITKRALRPHT